MNNNPYIVKIEQPEPPEIPVITKEQIKQFRDTLSEYEKRVFSFQKYFKEDYDTVEQGLTDNLFKIAEDLYAREWSFNVLDSSMSYEDLCNKGIEILEILKYLYKDGYKKT